MSNNNHHGSSKKTLMPHRLHDTPPYSDIFFNGDGFERYSNQYQNVAQNHHHDKHHHGSAKKMPMEMPHKLHDTPPYSDIFFNGDGFERYSNQPQKVAKYNGRKNKNEFVKGNTIDAQAADFIESRHKKFDQLSKTMSMM